MQRRSKTSPKFNEASWKKLFDREPCHRKLCREQIAMGQRFYELVLCILQVKFGQRGEGGRAMVPL